MSDRDNHLRAVIAAAANACAGDRADMMAALVGALVITATAIGPTDEALAAVIESINDARRRWAAYEVGASTDLPTPYGAPS